MTSVPKTAKKRKPGNRNAAIFYWCILALPILQFLIFYVGVNFNSVILSFQQYDFTAGNFVWEGFSAYKKLFSDIVNDMTLRYCLQNSFFVWLFTVIATTPLAVLFSYYIYKKRFLSGFFKVILFLPSIIPGIVLALMFQYFVEGGLPVILQGLGQELSLGLLYNPDTAIQTIIVFLVFTGFGTSVLLYTGAMGRIDNCLIESCQLDGGGSVSVLLHIILPQIYPTVTMQMVFGVATFFTSQAALYSFYGAGASVRNYTFGYWLFIKVVGDEGATYPTYPYASAAGVLFTCIAAPLTLLVKWAMEKFGPGEE